MKFSYRTSLLNRVKNYCSMHEKKAVPLEATFMCQTMYSEYYNNLIPSPESDPREFDE